MVGGMWCDTVWKRGPFFPVGWWLTDSLSRAHMRVCGSFKKVEMEIVGEGAVEGGWWTGGGREEACVYILVLSRCRQVSP